MSKKNKSTHKQGNPQVKKDIIKSESNIEDDIISAEVAEVIKDLPEDKRRTVIHALTAHHHSGPLPDGETIKIYSEVIPNGGDRLMKTVEKQLEHRVEIEKKGLNRTFNQSSTGQWMGFGIALVFGVIAWDLAKSGHDVVAGVLGAIDLVALVTVFITGRGGKN